MPNQPAKSSSSNPTAFGQSERHRRALLAFLAGSLIWLGPILACGSFQPRPTPTPTPSQAEILAAQAQPTPTPTETPVIIIQPTATFTPEPEPPTPVPAQPGTDLQVGQPARVIAAGGLNIRETPSTGGTLVIQLGVGQRVDVIDGPVSADGFVWWRMDDGRGNVGWGAEGDGDGEWLSAQMGSTQPVNRPPRVGDRVQVTMDAGQLLTIRSMPGTNSPQVTRATNGSQFTVIAGPQSANGFIWFQIRSDDGGTTGWAADGNNTTRWLSPLE
jgi:hypothetical protein